MKLTVSILALFVASTMVPDQPQAQELPQPAEGDFITHNFHFRSGETLPELKLHYATYGKPATDSAGQVTNAVMILHGTTGSAIRRAATELTAFRRCGSSIWRSC